MNRRSFLQFLGLAPIAPTVLAAMPAASVLPEPWLPPDTLPISHFAAREIDRITGLPQVNFRGINSELCGPITKTFDLSKCRVIKHEPPRISPALRA